MAPIIVAPSDRSAVQLLPARAETADSSANGMAFQAPSSFKLINSNHHVQTLENGSLTIRQAAREHEGLYMCEADNGVEPSLTKQVKLVVHRQAHFLADIQVLSQQRPQTGEPGGPAGSGGAGLGAAERQQPSGEAALLAAAAGAGQQAAQMQAPGQVVAIKSIKLPQNSSLVRLICAPHGDPPLQLDWLKDGRLIHTHSSNGPSPGADPIDHEPAGRPGAGPEAASEHLSQTIGRYHVNTRWLAAGPNRASAGGKFGGGALVAGSRSAAAAGPEEANGLESELLLTNLARHDAGLYTCAARNAHGQAERKLRLIVQEPPEPPSMVDVAHISSRFISLRWLAPFDGNSAIVKYVIEYRKLAASGQARAEPAGPDWEREAAAAAGRAPAPPPGRSEKLMPLAAGDQFGASAATSPAGEQATAAGGLQQQQQMQHLQHQHQLQLTSGGAQLQHTVHELEPMTRYSMRVVAFNALGASRPSVSLALRTEEEGESSPKPPDWRASN